MIFFIKENIIFPFQNMYIFYIYIRLSVYLSMNLSICLSSYLAIYVSIAFFSGLKNQRGEKIGLRPKIQRKAIGMQWGWLQEGYIKVRLLKCASMQKSLGITTECRLLSSSAGAAPVVLIHFQVMPLLVYAQHTGQGGHRVRRKPRHQEHSAGGIFPVCSGTLHSSSVGLLFLCYK